MYLSENPVKEARLRLNLTIDHVALAAGIDRQVIIRTEQGCYSDIPPSLKSYFFSQGVKLSNNDYHNWVAEKRYAAHDLLTDTLPVFSVDIHPFFDWRRKSGIESRSGFSKAFCVNPATTSKFENNLNTKDVPEQIIEALAAAQHGHQLIDLRRRYRIYREYQIFKMNKDNSAQLQQKAQELSKVVEWAENSLKLPNSPIEYPVIEEVVEVESA